MASKKSLTVRELIINAEKIFHQNRWHLGIVVCPYCGSMHIKEYDNYHYKCNSCKNRFTDKTNTLLRDSKLPVHVWMQAVYEMVNNNFISSISLAKKLGINQKSAWLIQTKLRSVMNFSDVTLTGVIAQDEMYVGGCLTNYHYGRKLRLLREYHLIGKNDTRYSKDAIFTLNRILKYPVFAMNDGNKIVMYAMPNPIKKEYVRKVFKKHVTGHSIAVADESQLYIDWKKATGVDIYTNNHHNNQYITLEGLTSNRIENTFSWYKRGFNSRITHCKRQYHQLYLNEYCFRHNTRNLSIEEKFAKLISCMIGNVVTYKQIKEYNTVHFFKSKAQLEREAIAEKKRMETLKTMFRLGFTASDGTIRNNGRIYTAEDFK